LEDRIRERTAELQQSQALIVQQEKQAAFGLLAAGIAHEVGNPLAGISSLVQLLKLRHEDEYTRSRLTMVDDQLRRIQRTLRELVGFSRPASSAKSLCDVHEILDAALSIAKYYKRKKGREIVTHYADGLPRLRLVRDQLVQVFLNLILNALDATEEGGRLEIRTRVQGAGSREQGSGDSIREQRLTTHHSPLTPSPDGEWICISIRDDGHGIPDADREAIFQPYYTTKQSGTGLGLFVCRHLLAEAGSGRLELTDTGPGGTTFTVLLKCGMRSAECGVAEPDSGPPLSALCPPTSSAIPHSAIRIPHFPS
jgi:signal transduction histidine kinase